MAYTVHTECFEGPLDLLLHLIQKNEIDICEIAIAQITGEYLRMIRQWQHLNLDIASEFIVMASRLLQIKSRSLLPKREDEAGEPSEDDLVQQLKAYQAFKNASQRLEQAMERESGGIYKDPEYLPLCQKKKIVQIDPLALQHYFERMLSKYEQDHTFRDPPQPIERESYSVEDQIQVIREALINSGKVISFSQTLKNHRRSEIVVTFQALLELYKANLICLEQEDVFGDIAISRRTAVSG